MKELLFASWVLSRVVFLKIQGLRMQNMVLFYNFKILAAQTSMLLNWLHSCALKLKLITTKFARHQKSWQLQNFKPSLAFYSDNQLTAYFLPSVLYSIAGPSLCIDYFWLAMFFICFHTCTLCSALFEFSILVS